MSGTFVYTPGAGTIIGRGSDLLNVTFTPTDTTDYTTAQASTTLVVTPSYSVSALASFNGTNGKEPRAALVADSSGDFYGTTDSGGANNDGTVFELAKGSSTITTLASFNGTNGSEPFAGLVMDSSGNLYGTTEGGGADSDGTVFELAKGSSTITTLASFNGTDGEYPYAGLVMDSSGNLYGTTEGGGSHGDGTIFELVKGSSIIRTRASFPVFGLGKYPYAGLVMDSSGNLYGTTYAGGNWSLGTVFELATGSTTFTTLASFNGTDGEYPEGALILDSGGNLYGTTSAGGSSKDGTVFELAKGSGTLTTLASFNGTDGSDPVAALILDSSGNLYGTTETGGAFSDGTVFERAQGDGVLTTLASFNGSDGANPYAGLILDSSGNLVGTTYAGGASGDGTVFELPGAVAELSFQLSGFPSSTSAGTAQTFTVTVLNAVGTRDTGYTGTVHFTSSDPQAVLPADYTFTAANDGTDTFTVTFKTAGSQAITATDTANSAIIGTEDNIIVQAAAAQSLKVTGFPTPDTAGTTQTFTVTAYDSYGNVATGYTGTLEFTSTDGHASLPANYTMTPEDQGTFAFSATLKTAGTQSITATDTVTSSIKGSDSNILVQPAALNSLVVTGFPTSATAGAAASITVTAYDLYGNLATNYTGTVSLTSTDPKAVLPASYMFAAADKGSHTFPVTLETVGMQSITATDASTGIKSTESGIAVRAAAAKTLAITGLPSTVTAGTAFNITVTAYDPYGNVATGYTGTVSFSSTDAKAVLPANYPFGTSNVGTQNFSVTFETSGTQSITVTDTSTASIAGSASTTVNSSASAVWIARNTTTEGNWIGVYGTDGYEVINNPSTTNPNALPAGVTITPTGATTYTWANPSTATPALEVPGGSSRIAACWYGSTSFTVDVNVTNGQSYNLELYVLDYNGGNARNEQIQLSNAGTGAVLSTETVSSFSNGAYLNWTISGNVLITITKTAGANAVLSGLFLDPASTSKSTPTITWAKPANIVYGTALSGTQLDATASVPGTFTYTPAAGTVLAVGNNQTLSVSFTPTDTTDYTSATATVTINVLAATTSATFLEEDTKTQGNWIGVYGTVGYDVINNPSTTNPNALPAGVTITPAGATLYTWANPSTATPALEVPGGTSRIAACWYASTSFTVDVDVTNGQSYNLELYVLDYNGGNARSEQIQLSNAGTGAVLSTETVSKFSSGAYLNWTISGNVLITITKTAGANAVLSGLFFDPATTSKSSPTITWANPANIVYGTALSSTQLKATASVSGTFTYTPAAGTQSITATDTANSLVTGSAPTTMTAAAASRLTIGGFPAPTTASRAENVTVTALDAYGNIATGYTGTVHFTSSDAGGVGELGEQAIEFYPKPPSIPGRDRLWAGSVVSPGKIRNRGLDGESGA